MKREYFPLWWHFPAVVYRHQRRHLAACGRWASWSDWVYEFNRAIAGEVKGAHIIAYLFGLFYVVFMDQLVYTQTLFSVFTPYLCLLC